MQRKALLLILSVIVGLAVSLLKLKADYGEDDGRTVRVSVQATDTSTATLHYQWRATEGVIKNIDASNTTWTLPRGPSLHFAYVLVSNGLGGYTERRLAINTDNFAGEGGSEGEPRPNAGESESEGEPGPFTAPPAPVQQGDYYRSFVAVDSLPDGTRDVYAPDVAVYLEDRNSRRYPATGAVLTNLRGEYIIPAVPPGDYIANCSFGGAAAFKCTSSSGGRDASGLDFARMASDASGREVATTDYAEPHHSGPVTISASFTLKDGSPCGTINEFFGVESTATATLLDAEGETLARVRVNEFGDYSLPSKNNAVSVLLECESATPVKVRMVFKILSISRSANVVTINTSDNNSFAVGDSVTIAGAVDTSYNGTFVIAAVNSPTQFTYSQAGANSSSSGGTATNLVLHQAKVVGVSAPTVKGMTASFNGQPLTAFTSPVALFMPPPTKFPGDNPPTDLPSTLVTRADGYLALKGLDSRRGACQYYKAIGAVQNCDAAGNLIGAISYNDWKRAVRIGEYAVGGVPTFEASFINAVDLNLARAHQSISYGENQTAAVVCNHLGIPISTAADFLSPDHSEINLAVDNTVHNKNLVACVAMDYMVSPGVNNNQPFVRFLIFGPSGQLLPSVNLDGRQEKFVPGTCVVCHGGDHYAGRFPEDGSGFANVGGHFLPYDVGNFEFSDELGLTKADQQLAIYKLNQNVLRAGPTVAEQELIAGIPATPGIPNSGYAGWYGGIPPTPGVPGSGSPDGHVLKEDYVPRSWQEAQSQNPSLPIASFYKNAHARSCRTCHVAMIEGYNFDHYENVEPGTGETQPYDSKSTKSNRFPNHNVDNAFRVGLCGGSPKFERAYMMPNSANTFNRFWLSEQPALFKGLYVNTSWTSCANIPGTTP
jgi:hypothetical protein